MGQVIEYTGCDRSQWILFADCTAGSAILIAGLHGEVAAAEGLGLSSRDLQFPYGPLALTPATTMAEVAALAAREGWLLRTDVAAWATERGPRNAVAPFLGCEVFYPGSVGAGR